MHSSSCWYLTVSQCCFTSWTPPLPITELTVHKILNTSFPVFARSHSKLWPFQYYQGGKFLENFVSVRDGPEKGTERSKAEMKEHQKMTLHLQKHTADVHVGYSSYVLSFLPGFCPFFRPIPNWIEVLYKLFPLQVVSVFFSRHLLNHLPIEDELVYCAGDKHF